MSAGDWKDLYQASVNGQLEIVKYHVKNGVDADYQHPEVMSTPLVGAIMNGHIDVALYLLGVGCNPRQLSILDDLTPRQAAKKHQVKELYDLLNIKEERHKSSFCNQIKRLASSI
jgi:ankyrin repeat protein